MKVIQRLILLCTLSIAGLQNSLAQDSIPAFGGYETIAEAFLKTSQPIIYDNKGAIRLGGEFSLQSNTVPFEFSKAFVFPTFIDEPSKQNAFEQLSEENRFGALFNWQAQVIFAPDSSTRAQGKYISVRFRENTVYAGRFGRNAFELIFGGNKQFAGKSANLDKTELFFMSYRNFEFGYFLQRSKASYAVHLGLAAGRNFQHIRVDRGSLFTSSDGTYLDLNWQGELYNSSAAESGLFNSRPIGAGLSLEFSQLIRKKWILSESLSDFGFIVWNPAGRTAQIDTAFRFTGIQLGNLLEINDSTIVLGDTLEQKLLGNNVRETRMQALPFHFSFSAERLFNKRWSGIARIDYRYIPGFLPQASIGVRKGFGKQRSLRFTLAYGGFGALQTSLDAVVFANHRHSLNIGTVYNEGFLMPRNSGNLGVRLFYVHHM